MWRICLTVPLTPPTLASSLPGHIAGSRLPARSWAVDCMPPPMPSPRDSTGKSPLPTGAWVVHTAIRASPSQRMSHPRIRRETSHDGRRRQAAPRPAAGADQRASARPQGSSSAQPPRPAVAVALGGSHLPWPANRDHNPDTPPRVAARPGRDGDSRCHARVARGPPLDSRSCPLRQHCAPSADRVHTSPDPHLVREAPGHPPHQPATLRRARLYLVPGRHLP